MRRSFGTLAAALLSVACFSEQPASHAPVLPSGSVMGATFKPADGAVYAPPQKQCAIGHTSVLALTLSTADGLCAAGSQPCARAASATTVAVGIVRLGPGQQPTVQPGTYAITAGSPTPDLSGNVEIVRATVTSTDAGCALSPVAPTATGTLTLTQLRGGHASGSVNLTFSDGGRLTGAFDVPICGSFDVCASCSSVTCQ